VANIIQSLAWLFCVRTVAVLSVILLPTPLCTPAVVAEELAADDRNPITIYTDDGAARRPGGLIDQLVQRARAQGQVRVIVGLRMTMRMEHTLSRAQAAAQLRVLQSVQSGVAARVLGSADSQSEDRFTFIPFMSMFVDAAQLRRLLADPQVVSVQEDVPSPPLLDKSAKLIHADHVWRHGFSGTGQVIAVLDTGVAKTHAMFAGKVVSEACYSTTNAATNVASVCPGGVAESTAPGSGVNCPAGVTGCDHGTHVAGIAVGNSIVRDGIARASELIAIQVFSRRTITNNLRSFDTDIIKGLQRVFALRNAHRIAAVNMSIGGGSFNAACDMHFPAFAIAITQLRAAGIATVIATGNNGFAGHITKPACISTAIAVGNTTKNDLIWRSSNHSDLVKLLAPGTGIRSAVLGNGYGVKSGTSMAAPHVAGALGLLRDVKPRANVDEMIEALTCSGKIVDQRFVTGGPPTEQEPQRPRIDMLGAYNHLKKPPNIERIWKFNSADDLDDWSPMFGTWKRNGGTYAPTPAGTWLSTYTANCNTKLEVTAKLRRTDNGSFLGFNSGIIIKTTANFDNETVSGYWFSYNYCRNADNGDCGGDPARPPGQAQVWRLDNFDVATGNGLGSVRLCRKAVAVSVGGFNTIRVVSDGRSHSYFLNNNLVCKVNDATYATGGVMLGAFLPNPVAGHSVAYDTVTIKAIGRGEARDESSIVMDPAAFAPVAAAAN
jgi:subtilisin family serine protease